MTESLSLRLKSATEALHREVEHSGIMRDLLHGNVSRSNYCILLRNLYEIYAALESSLASQAADPRLATILSPQVARATALAEDLRTLYGNDWQAALAPCAAAHEYRLRLETVKATQPLLLLAHAYVRYLGDLSGGQILRRMLAQALQLDSGEGLRFYEFGEPGARALAAGFRSALDSITLDTASADQIVEEAQLGFSLHARLFRELAA